VWIHVELSMIGTCGRFDGEGNLGNEVTCRRSDDAATNNTLGCLIEDQLGKPLTSAERQGAAAGTGRRLSVRNAGRLRLVR
jgi:hypothetical protein